MTCRALHNQLRALIKYIIKNRKKFPKKEQQTVQHTEDGTLRHERN
jgi:hypothetical protein